MKIHSLYDGGYGSMSYLVVSGDGEHAVLIDPSVSYAHALARVGTLPRIEALLLTHGHFDHIFCVDEWREKTGAPLCVCREDACMLTDPALSCYRTFFGEDTVHGEADVLLDEGTVISFGDESLRVFKTPGHTAGSCVYAGEGVLFTGDTIFSGGGYGRYDLPSGSPSHLYDSIRRIFLTYSGEYRIYPGHGGSSTLADERPYHSV